ncbi:secretin N-terminal domain-containing protein [Robbsia sp. Bb-Pol-6]|uniref:Secretin N-terminal domain-containing protein n=1 Tax=Robbsia betulipollinis TaxID=2981849 RepID=A0ABT3ZPJ7_9BURK|nr:secretin N-terminal domain-containing protein [Robbsia betulipollinis]MCY0387858.1 secretin N-terminal domain-containing protein [Robbsia betulipollinis]
MTWKTMLLGGTVALLSACQNLRTVEEGKARVDAVRSDIDAARVNADSARQLLAPLVEEDGAWLARRSIPIEETDVIPARFHRPASFHSGRGLPLSLILEKIAAGQGIAIHVAPDTLATHPTPPPTGRPPHHGGALRASVDGKADVGEARVQLNYAGTLRGLLDALANRSGTYWTYRDGSVVFARYKTRTFQIASMPGTSVFASSVGSQVKTTGEGGSGSGRNAGEAGSMQMNFGGTSLVGMGTNLNFWEEANTAIQSMLSPAGRVSASIATNSVTVTDTADVIDRIRRFVERENAVLGRQVSLRVQVFSVKLKQASQSGIDWSLAFQAGGVNAAIGAGNPDGAALRGALISASSGPWRNSRFLVAALQEQGDVTTVVDTAIVTLNNQPAPLAVTNNLTYLSKISVSQSMASSGGDRLYSAEPANLTTGFIMNLMPTLLDNRSVMLQVQLNLSSLISKGKAAFGPTGANSSITTPETSAIQTLQRASLKSGDTLLLTGFRRDDNDNQRRGLFSLLTGHATTAKQQEEFVILITPQLIEGV